MATKTIAYTEKMVGAGHPSLTDTLNRLTLVGHNTDGSHKGYVEASQEGSLMLTLAAVPVTTTIMVTDVQTVTPGTTISHPLIMMKGGYLSVPSGTVTINGPFEAGLYQVFAGSGAVVFGAGSVSEVRPEWFYDDSGNWATAINKAIQSAAAYQTVKLPAGTLPIKATTATECILYDKMLNLVGSGRNATILEVDAAVAATVDVIRVSPITTDGERAGKSGYIADFHITAASGTPAKNGIYLDTMVAAQVLDNLLIERVNIEAMGFYAIYQNSHATDPETFFSSTIRNCKLVNGIAMNRAGDTLRIENNEIRGKNYGIYIDLVQGANQTNITGNVVVSSGGGIYVQNAGVLNISGNQFEQQVAFTEPAKALVVLKGVGYSIYQPVISNNTFNLASIDAVCTMVYIDNVIGANLLNNRFGVGLSTQTIVETTSNSKGADIGKNFLFVGTTFAEWRAAARNTTYLKDAGYGTVGLYKVPTLLNSWTQVADHTPVSYEKISHDLISISGSITGGTKTDGTVLFSLPSGFRPQLYVDLIAYQFNSSTFNGYAFLTIDPNSGDVSVYGVNSNTTRLSLDNITLRLYQ